MEDKLSLEKISSSFESNIQAIKVLNETIGCIADDHDKKVRKEFEEKALSVLDAFVNDIKEKHKDLDLEKDEAEKIEEELSEEEAKKISNAVQKVLFADDEFVKAHKKLEKSAPKQGPILRRGALVSLLGCFETTISKLIREFYRKYPEAFPSDSKSLTLADLKEIGSVEDAELHLVDSEIDSILRGNIESQLKYFIKPIKIQTKPIEQFLDKLIEISQRRNILVHNDGIVNKHYLSKTPKSQLTDNAKEGCLIKVDQDYLNSAINTINIVGTLIIQQCFRKWEKEHIDEADTILIESVFESLVDENYEITILLADYAKSIKMTSDSNQKIIVINQAIALRDSGKSDEMNTLLDEYDWSSASLKFQLALYSLKQDENEFYETLEKTISAKELGCHELTEWPLFKPFQPTEKYQDFIKKHWPDQTECESKEKS